MRSASLVWEVSDDQFYREFILDHYRNPRNFGRLEAPDIVHEEYNPLCGDLVGMDFRLCDEVIEEVSFFGRGCAISQASASLLTERLRGMSLEEAKGISKEDVLNELGIEISPARLKCALLSLKVLKAGAYGLTSYDPEEEDKV
jgi:nitrogen fixation NifU-like protein